MTINYETIYNILDLQKAGYKWGFLANNRKPDPSHVNRMKDSIMKLGRNTAPIVFTEAEQLNNLGFTIKDKDGRIVTDINELKSMLVPLDGSHKLMASIKILEEMKGKPEHELPKITANIICVPDKDYVDTFLMEANINSKVWDSEAYLRSYLSHLEYTEDKARMKFAVELIDKGLKIDNALRLSTGNESSIPTKTQLAKACVANGDKFRKKLADKKNVDTVIAIKEELWKHLGTNLLNTRVVVKQLVKIISNKSYLDNNVSDIKDWLNSITPDDTVEMAAYKNSKNGDSKDVKLHNKMEAMYTRWKGQTKTP